jgi:hypothetical protein
MYWLALQGKMGAELERVCGGDRPADHSHQDHLDRGRDGSSHENGSVRATA